MNRYITTYTKIHFTPADPKIEEIYIQDIAHALSMMTRANGHFPEFYSVAQHCIACAGEAEARGLSDRAALGCLLHDASEAYLADITSPVKQDLAEYRRIEAVLQTMIYEKFLPGGLSHEEEIWVQTIDRTLFYYEFDFYMQEKMQPVPPKLYSSPVFETIDFAEAEKRYQEVFGKLSSAVYSKSTLC